jgi:hypothetical protein
MYRPLVSKSGRDATSNFAGQVGGDLADRGTQLVSSAGDQAKTFASELETMARRNPLGSLAGAVAIGVSPPWPPVLE